MLSTAGGEDTSMASKVRRRYHLLQDGHVVDRFWFFHNAHFNAYQASRGSLLRALSGEEDRRCVYEVLDTKDGAHYGVVFAPRRPEFRS